MPTGKGSGKSCDENPDPHSEVTHVLARYESGLMGATGYLVLVEVVEMVDMRCRDRDWTLAIESQPMVIC